ncbi:bactericidal permeability-increasing protein-like [Cololabis saira]|uniref:bactericidal permeability-increasing protein-like n=1 Tax=Cololabis saira TaxID=129043 RepID=UPI002AD465A3|nr:bactericidal permeability-increasing protein-like [Cololabis saira]XP_061583947.1 bactericidal permeability-increasing protein-like [Cololabis saira]
MLICFLTLVALIPTSSSINPGVKVRLTEKGLEYGRVLGMAALQQKLKSIKIPDFSGKTRVSPIGKVEYSFSNIQIVNVGLPQSSVTLVPGTGVGMRITNAVINLNGNWRVKFLRWIRKSGSFSLNVNGLTISTSTGIKSDAMGRPEVSSVNCAASVGSARVKFHGGDSWLYNLFSQSIDKALRKEMEKKICPLVSKAVSDLNPELKTLNVVAKVDKHAEIEYSLVSSPTISKPAIELNLKGEFYNIGNHQEPPFTAAAFSLPQQNNKMLYIGISAFTANSAAFVYNRAGLLTLYITDDMIPKSSPVRLSTRTFGVFIPEIAKRFPGLMMKLLVKAEKNPITTFEPNNMTIQATAAVTAYAIQPNGTLSPLFVLHLDTSVTANMVVSGMKLVGKVGLNKMSVTLGTSYVGQFQVRLLDNILQLLMKTVVIPIVNVQLAKGYPLPALGKMSLQNTQLQVLKDFMMIGTDVQFKI